MPRRPFRIGDVLLCRPFVGQPGRPGCRRLRVEAVGGTRAHPTVATHDLDTDQLRIWSWEGLQEIAIETQVSMFPGFGGTDAA